MIVPCPFALSECIEGEGDLFKKEMDNGEPEIFLNQDNHMNQSSDIAGEHHIVHDRSRRDTLGKTIMFERKKTDESVWWLSEG